MKKNAHPATTSTAWLPRNIKRKLCCRILYYIQFFLIWKKINHHLWHYWSSSHSGTILGHCWRNIGTHGHTPRTILGHTCDIVDVTLGHRNFGHTWEIIEETAATWKVISTFPMETILRHTWDIIHVAAVHEEVPIHRIAHGRHEARYGHASADVAPGHSSRGGGT